MIVVTHSNDYTKNIPIFFYIKLVVLCVLLNCLLWID